MTHYRETMRQTLERMYEINERKRSESIVEASMKPAQIAALKKAYEPMRGKRISSASANKLDKLMNKFAKEKDLLIQILKADIPFVSTKAATILLFKHGMEPSEINKLKEEVELDEKTKWRRGDGRPRGAAHIENERFWDLPKSSLEYIIKDAGEAMRLNPTARKATTGRGNWADQVNDAHTVLGWRRKNGIKEEVELDEAKIAKKVPAKDGGYFVVLHRDTKGMRGTQDKFLMRVLNKGKVKELGSHPSLDGALKFAKNRGIIEEVELDEEMMVYRVSSSKLQGNVHAKDEKEAEKIFRSKGAKGKITVTLMGPVSKRRTIRIRDEVELELDLLLQEDFEFVLEHADQETLDAIESILDDALANSQIDEGIITKALGKAAVGAAKLAVKGATYGTAASTAERERKKLEKARQRDKDLRTIEKSREERKKLRQKNPSLLTKVGKAAATGAKKTGGAVKHQLDRLRKKREDLKKEREKIVAREGRRPSARADAMKAMKRSGEFKDKDDDDIRATDADVKAASKNILMQMKSAADLPKGGEIEFLDKKKIKVPQKVAQLFVRKYMSLRRPADKAKFQERAAKSYKDFVSAMKEEVESEHTILDRIHNKIQERKNV